MNKQRFNDSGPYEDLTGSVPEPDELRSILASHEKVSSFLQRTVESDLISRGGKGQLPYISLFYNLEEILSQIVHDGKNYLGPIKGYASILKNRFVDRKGALDDDIRCVDKIMDNILLTEQFFGSLSLYRLKGAFKKENVSLGQLIGETLEVFRFFNKRGIEIEVINELEGKYEMRRELMQRILLNLLRNAYESIATKGKILLAVSSRSAQDSASAGFTPVLMKITDNGIGINQSKLDYVWKPFFTTKPRHFGLGLSYVSMASAILRIKVAIKSRPQYGTTVSLLMNLEGGEIEAQETAGSR